MKKRIITLLLAAIMLMSLVSLTSCKKENEQGNTPDVSATPNSVGVGTPEITPKREIKENTPNAPVKLSFSEPRIDGKNFSIDVLLDNSAGWTWCTYEFTINYDPSILEIDEESDIALSEYTKAMSAQNNITYGEGKIRAAALSLTDFTDDGILCTINAEIIGDGTFDLSLTDALMFRIVTYLDGTQSSEAIALEVTGDKTVTFGAKS